MLLRPGLLLLLLAVGACGGGGGAAVTGTAVGPVLAHLTPTTARIGWRTVDAQPGRLSYGPAGGALVHMDLPAAIEQDVLLTGLSEDTAYRYGATAGGTSLGPETAFRTPAAAPGSVLEFDVTGDSGTGFPPSFTVFDNITADAPDLVWICGDCAYQYGSEADVRRGFTNPLAELRTYTPLYTVLGNHDIITRGGRPLLDAVFLPTNSATGTEHYYAFERGDCLFVGLDSNRSIAAGSAQNGWLAATLAAATKAWTFVFLHHTTYSSSNHGSSGSLQASLAPLVDAAGVDIVFCGHDHDYERTFPLQGGTPVGQAADPDYTDPGGPVWVVTGGGGASLYGSGTSAFTAYSDSIYHHVRVRVEAGRLDLEAVNLSGAVFDRMSITKTP